MSIDLLVDSGQKAQNESTYFLVHEIHPIILKYPSGPYGF